MVVIGGSDKEIALLRVQYPLVQFLGARPYRELPLNQQAADILVVPNTAKNTLSSSYTSPLKLFAHMTARIPLIVSDIPSLRAVVDDSAVSFFSPDDSQSLAHAISKVLQSPEDSQKKASVAYEKSKQHTWRKRAERVLAHLMVNKEPR